MASGVFSTWTATRSPGFRPSGDDQVGNAAAGAAQVAVGPHPAVGQDHAGRVGIRRKMRGENFVEIVIHDFVGLLCRDTHHGVGKTGGDAGKDAAENDCEEHQADEGHDAPDHVLRAECRARCS